MNTTEKTREAMSRDLFSTNCDGGNNDASYKL